MFGVWSLVVNRAGCFTGLSTRWWNLFPGGLDSCLFECIKLLQCTMSFIQSFCFPKVEELKAVKCCCFPEMSLWYCQTTSYRLVFPCSFVMSVNQSIWGFFFGGFFFIVLFLLVFLAWEGFLPSEECRLDRALPLPAPSVICAWEIPWSTLWC